MFNSGLGDVFAFCVQGLIAHKKDVKGKPRAAIAVRLLEGMCCRATDNFGYSAAGRSRLRSSLSFRISCIKILIDKHTKVCILIIECFVRNVEQNI